MRARSPVCYEYGNTSMGARKPLRIVHTSDVHLETDSFGSDRHGERLRSLRSRNQPKVMLGMLQIILCRDRISARMRISCELEIFLRDMMRVAAYFDVRSVGFIGSRQRIGPPPIVHRPAAHPFVLTWSHFDFPTSIRLCPQLRDHFRRKLFRF